MRKREHVLAKAMNVAYREALEKRLGVPVKTYAEVRPVEGGAYVEVFMWVPETEALAHLKMDESVQ